MKLAEVLEARHVVPELPGGGVGGAAALLVDQLLGSETDEHRSRIRERLDTLSAEDVVALPDRAFLVHFRTDFTREPTLLAGVTSEAFVREPGDAEGPSARLLLLFIAPAKKAAEYLQLLGALGRLFARGEVVDGMIAWAGVPDELAMFLNSTEFDVPAQLRVRDIMNARARTTSPDSTLREAAREMVRSGLSALIVVDSEGRVVGQLGEKELLRDLFNNYLQGDTSTRDAPGSTGRRRVREVMTRQVLGVTPNIPLAEVASIMVNKDVERVPVVEDGVLVGTLTRADIVRKIIGY